MLKDKGVIFIMLLIGQILVPSTCHELLAPFSLLRLGF